MHKLVSYYMKNRSCKTCGETETIAWYKDKCGLWGNKDRLGFFCHICFNSIRQKESNIGAYRRGRKPGALGKKFRV